MKNSLRKLSLLGTFLFLTLVTAHTQDIQAAFNKQKKQETENFDPEHCDHTHQEEAETITNVVTSRETISEMPQVRDVLLVQQSLVDALGIQYITQAYEDGLVFFENAIYNSGDMYGIEELTNLLEPNASEPQMFNVVAFQAMPDSLFTPGGNTSVLLNQFTDPNDGYFDERSPEVLSTKYNQARYAVILANETVGTSGTAGTEASVLRRSSVDPNFGTHIQSHEDGHRFFALHSAAVQLTEDAIVGGVTIAQSGDWSLENGVGPYQPFLSESGVDTIMNSGSERGIIDASYMHPSLDIAATSPSLTAQVGDFVVCDTEIHSSRANVEGLQVTITDPNGNVLQSGIHDSQAAQWTIQIPAGTETGAWYYTTTIFNSHTDEYASKQIDITIEEIIPPDIDGDGVPDGVDIDNDNDGVSDIDEIAMAQNGGDTDLDGTPDQFDLDSDDDNVGDRDERFDETETGYADVVPTGDNNQNGMDDAYEARTGSIPDTDNDGKPNPIDDDDDGDGDMTIEEDENNNNDPRDDDKDQDGTPDFLDDEITTSTTEVVATNTMKIYPNPTSGGFTIKPPTSFQDKNFTITITDPTGRVVYQKGDLFYGDNAKLINFHAQSVGVYFISINNGRDIAVSRIVYQ